MTNKMTFGILFGRSIIFRRLDVMLQLFRYLPLSVRHNLPYPFHTYFELVRKLFVAQG
jgi:hypothetical protein